MGVPDPPGNVHTAQLTKPAAAEALSVRCKLPERTTYKISLFAGDCSITLHVEVSPVEIASHITVPVFTLEVL